jgi:hypothetical protein
MPEEDHKEGPVESQSSKPEIQIPFVEKLVGLSKINPLVPEERSEEENLER